MEAKTTRRILGRLVSIVVLGGALRYLGYDLWYTAAFLALFAGILGLYSVSDRGVISDRLASGIVLFVAISISGIAIVRGTESIVPAFVLVVALWLAFTTVARRRETG